MRVRHLRVSVHGVHRQNLPSNPFVELPALAFIIKGLLLFGETSIVVSPKKPTHQRGGNPGITSARRYTKKKQKPTHLRCRTSQYSGKNLETEESGSPTVSLVTKVVYHNVSAFALEIVSTSWQGPNFPRRTHFLHARRYSPKISLSLDSLIGVLTRLTKYTLRRMGKLFEPRRFQVESATRLGRLPGFIGTTFHQRNNRTQLKS